MAGNFKFINYLFLEFPFNIFRPFIIFLVTVSYKEIIPFPSPCGFGDTVFIIKFDLRPGNFNFFTKGVWQKLRWMGPTTFVIF